MSNCELSMGWRGGGSWLREKDLYRLSREAQESFAISGSVGNSENGDWSGSRARRGRAWEAQVQ